jgi:alcohol dehydrogenase
MMMAAAAMGATAFQKGLGAIHSLSHPVGSLHGAHHGLTNAVFMPYVLVFNRPAIEARIERLAAYLGLAARFEAFHEWVLGLRREIGVPHTLVALGVPLENADLIAEMAIVDPTAGSNPVELTKAAARGIFDRAASGDIA